MARLSLSEPKIVNESDTLEELIPTYALNKEHLDKHKKICDAQNTVIKEQLEKLGQDEYSAGGYVAKRTVVTKESMNEDRLLDILKQHDIPDIVKTKEYVDMDALEKYLYNNEMSPKLAKDLDSCREVKEVIQLRISKERAKKED